MRRDAWIAQADELARLRDEVRGSAEREAMEIVTGARRDVRQIVMEARRELLVLSAQVQAALGEAGARPDPGALLNRSRDTDGGNSSEDSDLSDSIFAPEEAVKGMLEEARADMDALIEDARTVPFQALRDAPALMPPPEPSILAEPFITAPPPPMPPVTAAAPQLSMATSRVLLSSPFPSEAVPVPPGNRVRTFITLFGVTGDRRPRWNDLVASFAERIPLGYSSAIDGDTASGHGVIGASAARRTGRVANIGSCFACTRSQRRRAFVESVTARRSPSIVMASNDDRRRVRRGAHAGRGRDIPDQRAAQRVVAGWRCRRGLCLGEQWRSVAARPGRPGGDAAVRGRERRSRGRCGPTAAEPAEQSEARVAAASDRIGSDLVPGRPPHRCRSFNQSRQHLQEPLSPRPRHHQHQHQRRDPRRRAPRRRERKRSCLRRRRGQNCRHRARQRLPLR